MNETVKNTSVVLIYQNGGKRVFDKIKQGASDEDIYALGENIQKIYDKPVQEYQKRVVSLIKDGES